MAFVERKCPNCGANIVADDLVKKASCIYCHTEFSVEKESSADGADGENEDIFDRAETFLTVLEKQEEAAELFREYAMLEPADYRGWWGIARAYSDNFSDITCSAETYAIIEENVELAMKAAGDGAETLRTIWDEYKKSVICTGGEEHGDSATYAGSVEAQRYHQRIKSLDLQITAAEAQLAVMENEFKPLSKKKKVLCWSLAVFYGVSLIPIVKNRNKKKAIENQKKQIEQLREAKQKAEEKFLEIAAKESATNTDTAPEHKEVKKSEPKKRFSVSEEKTSHTDEIATTFEQSKESQSDLLFRSAGNLE